MSCLKFKPFSSVLLTKILRIIDWNRFSNKEMFCTDGILGRIKVVEIQYIHMCVHQDGYIEELSRFLVSKCKNCFF